MQAIATFYEGSGGPIPWAAWLPALVAWGVFYAGFYLTLISVGTILRRQWVEHEHLAYPLMQVPLAMIEEGNRKQVIKPFFKSWSMWCGFALPCIVSSLSALHNYFPAISPVVLSTSMEIIRERISLTFGLNFLMIGFAYFIHANVSFSLWFFYLLLQLQEGIFLHLGIDSSEAALGWWTEPGLGHQMMGALIAMVISGLWVGRGHLKAVWRKAVRGDDGVVDGDEIMSYRSALLGLATGLATMWIWLWKTGIPAWIAPVFIFAALVIFIGLARIIAETGLPIVKATMIPAGFVVSSVGVPALGIKGMIATGYTMIWCGDLLVFMLAPLSNGLRLGTEITGNRRRLFWAIAAAMAIGLVLSMWFTIHMAYTHGSLNLLLSKTYAQEPSRFAAQKLADPTGPNLTGWIWMGGGGLFMTLLIMARQRFLWWPFHPVGFLASMGWIMDGIWFTIFLAWILKVVVLKYGGPHSYQRPRPFFWASLRGRS